MEFKTWVEVSFKRMETLKALELPDVFTTEPGSGRIRVMDQSEISSAALHQWNKEQPTLTIFPTSRPLISFHPNVHVVPYSDHSSYQELEDFVSALKPTSLVPIVGNCLPGSLSALLPCKKRHEILVPESVRHYMLKQPERQLSSSTTYTSLQRRHFRPLSPKGVVFDSPVKGFRKLCKESWEEDSLEQDESEEEMDTESSERDSDCILVDASMNLTPKKTRGGAGDTWKLNIVQTVSEEIVMAESVPLSQLTQSNFAPMEILTNTKGCLNPIRTVRNAFETKAKMGQSQHKGHVTLSDGDSMSQHSGTHQSCRTSDLQTVIQTSPDNASLASSTTSNELQREYVEEHENRLLMCLHFSEEDFKQRGLQPQSFVQKFTLLPFKDEDDI